MFKKSLIFTTALIFLISCDSNKTNVDLNSDKFIQQDNASQIDEVKNFKTAVNKDNIKVIIEAQLLTKNTPHVTPFTPFESQYMIKLIDVKFNGNDGKTDVKISASKAVSNSDYTRLKFYGVKELKINGKEQKDLESKKVVIFLEDKKLVLSIEPI